MNTPGETAQRQLEGLLKLIEEGRRERCEEIVGRARQQRGEIVAEAYRQARSRMHEAIREERDARDRRLERARAQVQTRTRAHAHQTAKLLLHRGWERLRETLCARWGDTDGRRLWVEGLAALATASLPKKHWSIDHPAGWSSAEADTLRRHVEEHCGSPPEFREDTSMAAGLRIWTDGVCLDGSLEGVMADRAEIEATLLAELARLEGRIPGPGERE